MEVYDFLPYQKKKVYDFLSVDGLWRNKVRYHIIKSYQLDEYTNLMYTLTTYIAH